MFEPACFLGYGAFGSGKTTLLSMLGCLLTPDEGSVFVDNVLVSQLSETEKTVIRQKKIGFVFQAFRLFHSLSAIDNVALALNFATRNSLGDWKWRDNCWTISA